MMTFGSHANYIDAADRLVHEADSLHLFTEIRRYTPEQFPRDFLTQHADFISKNPRGYGYWVWKPYLILQEMNRLNDGDILLYLDCGCELRPGAREKLMECIPHVKRDKLLCAKPTLFPETMWTKMDLIDRMGMRDHYFTYQLEGGILLFLVCHEMKTFLKEWYTLCCTYANIDDSPSRIPNMAWFVEHRHDQSVFSLLAKKYTVSSHPLCTAIHYARNKTGVSTYREDSLI